jgi:UDP-2-acetamido-3-amino-2,3-dideoxy-glucuronate N-acetyltransferase
MNPQLTLDRTEPTGVAQAPAGNSQPSTPNSQPCLALIGAGYWGKNLARNFNALGALRTLCDASELTLSSYNGEFEAVAKCLDFERVLEDPAITRVALAAPAVLHYDLAKAALLAGKDVFVEKPLCLHAGQARELVALAKANTRVLMVGHLLQYHPCIQKLQAMLAQGELGKLHYITSNRLNLGKIRREENALWSFAPHDLSVILSLAGHQLPEQVRCTGEAYLTNGVADTTLTSLRFAGNIRAHVFVSWLNPFKEQKLTVVGSNGIAVFDDTRPWNEKLMLYRQYLTWTNGTIPTPSKAKAEPIAVPEAEPLREECLHFLKCCQDRRAPRTDGHEGLRVLQVLEAAQLSLEKDGEAVKPSTLAPRPTLNPQPSSQPPHSTLNPQPSTSYYVHPTALVDDGAVVGRGTKLWHFSHVMKGAQIGERCVFGQNVNVDGGTIIGNNVKVQNNVSLYTGMVVEDDVFLGPSCVLTNVTNPRSQVNRHSLYEKTVIKRGATVGANATIVCGVTLGRYCFIGAGAVVTKDAPDYALILGNPGRQKGWMSRHGHRLNHPDSEGTMRCPESGYRYQLQPQPSTLDPQPLQTLRCLDLGEESALPKTLAKGTKSYEQFKHSSQPLTAALHAP